MTAELGEAIVRTSVDKTGLSVGLADSSQTVEAWTRGMQENMGAATVATRQTRDALHLLGSTADQLGLPIGHLGALLRATTVTMKAAGDAGAAMWLKILGPVALVVAAVTLVGGAVTKLIDRWNASKDAAIAAMDAQEQRARELAQFMDEQEAARLKALGREKEAADLARKSAQEKALLDLDVWRAEQEKAVAGKQPGMFRNAWGSVSGTVVEAGREFANLWSGMRGGPWKDNPTMDAQAERTKDRYTLAWLDRMRDIQNDYTQRRDAILGRFAAEQKAAGPGPFAPTPGQTDPYFDWRKTLGGARIESTTPVSGLSAYRANPAMILRSQLAGQTVVAQSKELTELQKIARNTEKMAERPQVGGVR